MDFRFPIFLAVLVGVLATADIGVLEGVQDLRVRYGFGLTEAAPAGAVLLAVEDCRWLGRDGEMDVDGLGQYKVRVVDCQQVGHKPLHELGLAADSDGAHPEFNGRRAVVVIR